MKWYDKDKVEHLLEVNDIGELEDAIETEMDEFCERLFEQEDMTRPIHEGDPIGDMGITDIENSFMWTTKADKLIINEINRWGTIAAKYYPDRGIEVKTNWYVEF